MDIQKTDEDMFLIGKHGFVKLLNCWGDDHTIAESARNCVGGLKEDGSIDEERDERLIRHLIRNGHTSPIEMVETRWLIKAPIDVWRQWIRHRTASVNEYSTRYSEAIEDMVEVSPDEWRKQSSSRRQGSDGNIGSDIGEELTKQQQDLHKLMRTVYEGRLSVGVSREMARMDLPLCNYTQAVWKIDLHNLFHFLKLRTSLDAQQEIRIYAKCVGMLISKYVPAAYAAYMDYIKNAITFSGLELNCMASIFSKVSKQEVMENWMNRYGMEIPANKQCTERDEFIAKLDELNLIREN